MQAARPPCRLTATDVACRRGDRLLFTGMSLLLEPGQACHIIGANGIGKSSLIRILAGLAAPWAGSVARTGAIGLIDERSALSPQLPLGQVLHFWASIDRGDIGTPADRLGLADLFDVPVRYLSTGQRKRAALARLVAQDAAIWLLDEPLNGLDHTAVALVTTLAAEHCRRGGICVIASHQPFALAGITTLDLAGFAA